MAIRSGTHFCRQIAMSSETADWGSALVLVSLAKVPSRGLEYSVLSLRLTISRMSADYCSHSRSGAVTE